MGKTQARRKTAAKPKVTAKPKSSPVKKASAKTAGAKKIAAASKKKEADTPFITTLTIENFKSIKSLKLTPKRVNVFIGEPNSGKTNILEALSLLSVENINKEYLFNILRIEKTKQLFFEQNSIKTIQIETNRNKYLVFKDRHNTSNVSPSFFYLLTDKQNKTYLSREILNSLDTGYVHFSNTSVMSDEYKFNDRIETNLHLYIYSLGVNFIDSTNDVLNQPDGNNIITLLNSNKSLRELVNLYLNDQEQKIIVFDEEQKIDIVTEKDGVLFAYPFKSLSETLRRYIFLEAVLKTNNKNVILLDEPDTHSFPAYVKQFAEEVGINEENQFFITTHSPYLLGSIIEKTPIKDLNVYVCRKNNGTTEAIRLSEKQLDELTEMGISSSFFNLDDFYPENA